MLGVTSFFRIKGEEPYRKPEPRDRLEAAQDLFSAYSEARRSKKHQTKEAPHYAFANCDSTEKLEAFVQKYGPVWADRLLPTDLDMPDFEERVLVALEGIEKLKRERAAFAALLRLISLLTGERPAPRGDLLASLETLLLNSTTNKSLKFLARSYGSRSVTPPLFVFPPGEEDLIALSHEAVAAALDEHKPTLQPIYDTKKNLWSVVELPRVWEQGIRPGLLLMARYDYLHGHAVGVCQRNDCRELFAATDFNERFCSPVCSRLQRQRDYYHETGAEKRRERKAKAQESRLGQP